jgi:hypothetical protein
MSLSMSLLVLIKDQFNPHTHSADIESRSKYALRLKVYLINYVIGILNTQQAFTHIQRLLALFSLVRIRSLPPFFFIPRKKEERAEEIKELFVFV